MNIDIDNINTIEKRNKVYTKQWRTIYEVIQQDFLDETDIFPDYFIKHCKNNTNEAHNIPLKVKNYIKRMLVGKGLYAQVVILSRKGLRIIEENKNKNEAEFKFQGQSTGLQRWFDIYFDWIEENCSTREPDFYRKIFQSHDKTQDTNTFKMFEVPIGNSKCVEKLSFTVRPKCSSIVESG